MTTQNKVTYAFGHLLMAIMVVAAAMMFCQTTVDGFATCLLVAFCAVVGAHTLYDLAWPSKR